MLKTLRNRAIVGIIGAVLQVPWVILEFLKASKKLSGNIIALYYTLVIVEAIIYIYFVWGFKIIGDKLKNKLLSISSTLIIASAILLHISVFFDQKFTPIVNAIIWGAILVITGALSIPFGIGLLRLKDKFGNLAKAVGILNIITGISFVTIILFFIGLLIYIPLGILEIILMFKAAEKL